MNKKTIKAVLFAAVVAVVGYNVYETQREEPMSEIALANVEALASGEVSTTTTWTCSGFWGDCYAICGACMTQIGPSNGQLSGAHKCYK